MLNYKKILNFPAQFSTNILCEKYIHIQSLVMLLKMFNANRLTDNIPSLQLKKMRTFPIRKKKILIFYFLHSDK